MSKVDLSNIQIQPNKKGKAERAEAKAPVQGPQMDAIFLAYFALVEAVNVQQRTIQIQAKGLDQNAQEQAKHIASEADLRNVIITDKMIYDLVKKSSSDDLGQFGPDQAPVNNYVPPQYVEVLNNQKLEVLQDYNIRVSNLRDGVTNQLVLLRQKGSVTQALLGSGLDNDSQTLQALIAVLQLIVTLSNQATQLGGR